MLDAKIAIQEDGNARGAGGKERAADGGLFAATQRGKALDGRP